MLHRIKFHFGKIGLYESNLKRLGKADYPDVYDSALLNEYQINKIKINHFDLFRLKSPNEIKDLNLFDNISNTITLIEWPQIIQEKPKNLIELIFEYGEEHQTR